MTSRERVQMVLNHQIPDRIPNGLGGCETAGLHVLAYDSLQNVLSLERKPTRLDTFMTNAVFEENVITAMEGDIILLDSPNMSKSRLRGNVDSQWKDQTLWGKTFRVSIRDSFREEPDGSVIWETCGDVVCPKGSFFFDSKESTDLLADFDVPDPDDFHPRDDLTDEFLRNLEETAKDLYHRTDLSICLGEAITDLQYAPGGMVGSMVLMLEEPDVMHALLEKCADAALKQIVLLEQAVGKYVDMLSIAHDFGDNRGVTMGDRLWRQIYKPHYHKLFQGWQARTGMKINFHSCGSIDSILPDLIECGLQVLNPVQTSAANMSAKHLKECYGKDIVFWGGGYDTQLVQSQASYEQVYAAVRENLSVLGAGGGYIFSGVHNLPADVPQVHIKAMLDAFRDGRNYE